MQPKIKAFNELWHLIHSCANSKTSTHNEILETFEYVLTNLGSCDCKQDASWLFMSMLNNDIQNFFKLNIPNGTKAFFHHFHNSVNLKLCKPVFENV